eukprot:1190937-Prorocentrum_minimum.AAC.4
MFPMGYAVHTHPRTNIQTVLTTTRCRAVRYARGRGDWPRGTNPVPRQEVRPEDEPGGDEGDEAGREGEARAGADQAGVGRGGEANDGQGSQGAGAQGGGQHAVCAIQVRAPHVEIRRTSKKRGVGKNRAGVTAICII